jgi:flagellin-like protein
MLRSYARRLRRDDAVSPVIAVILMVAITVVLAATVYVWVSGFGSSSSSAARTMSLTSAGSISTVSDYKPALATGYNKTYTVASATSGMKWSDVTFTLNGVTLAYHDFTTNSTAIGADEWCLTNAAGTGCTTGTSAPTSVVGAGQTLVIHDETSLSGQVLRVLDANANSVIASITIG